MEDMIGDDSGVKPPLRVLVPSKVCRKPTVGPKNNEKIVSRKSRRLAVRTPILSCAMVVNPSRSKICGTSELLYLANPSPNDTMNSAYSAVAARYHWAVAIPLIGSVYNVLAAQQAPKEKKGELMFRHKSLGLLTGLIVLPRVGYRLFNRQAYSVEKIAGSGSFEHSLGVAAHYALYGFMIAMPATGVAMGYYGGKGLPFFWTTLPGVVKTDENKQWTGQIAKQSFSIHKTMGVYGKYLIPAHAAGAFGHYFRGQTVFSRINPFRSGAPKH